MEWSRSPRGWKAQAAPKMILARVEGKGDAGERPEFEQVERSTQTQRLPSLVHAHPLPRQGRRTMLGAHGSVQKKIEWWQRHAENDVSVNPI